MLKYSPYYLTVITIFGPVIEFFFGHSQYLYLVKFADYLALTSVVAVLFIVSISKDLIKKISPIVIIWFIFIIIHLLYSISVIEQEIILALIGSYSYLIYFLYWYFYLNLYGKKFVPSKYLKFVIHLSFFIAIVAIYQYFVDMSLFGYASSINSIFRLDQYYKYSEIRVTSIFTSIQVFSCFISLAFILLLDNIDKFKNIQSKVLLLSLLFAGFLSGSKIFLLSILVGLCYLYFVKNRKYNLKHIIVVTFALSFILTSFIYLINSPYKQEIIKSQSPIARIGTVFLDIDKIIFQETSYEKSRINVYKRNIFENDYWILGHGLGKFNSIADKERPALESYLLQVFMEIGLIGVILFLVLFLRSYVSRPSLISIKGLTIIMILLMAFNQAFDAIVFFPFYGFFIYSLIINNNTSRVEVVS